MAQAALIPTTFWRLSAADITDIRRHLRDRLEDQAHRARDIDSMTDLWRLAETTDDIEAELIEICAGVSNG